MIRQNILNGCINHLNKLIIRRKSVVIRQIDTTKLTKAQRMKKLNYETSYLFGSKIKKENKSVDTIDKDEKGFNSEMYWTMADKFKSKKQLKEEKEEDNSGLKKKAKKSLTNSTKKQGSIEVERLPETFAKFKLDLPKPVKVTIQDALSNIDSQISNNQKSQDIKQNEIPFDQSQLRNLVNFPLVVEQNNLIADMFDKCANRNYMGYTPSVSKIIQATMSASQRQALLQWKNLKIAELGIQGFEEMQKNYLSRGKKFHECLQKHFNNVEISDDDLSIDIIEVWKSISYVLNDFEKPAALTEHHIYHPYLFYKGIVDCVAVHRETQTLSVIEWKNSDRYKRSLGDTYDAPLQLCAYLAALNQTEFKANPLKKGVIVVAYNDGQEADCFQLSVNDIQKYWKVWLNRVQDYWVRYRDNTLSLDEI